MLKEYYEGILILCAFIAMAMGISHPKLKSATSFGAGVLVICAILLPLVNIIKDNNLNERLDEYIYNMEFEPTDDMIEAAFESGISAHLADEYRVDAGLITVMADGFELDKMKARKIYVTLSGEAAFLDYKRIEDEVAREFTLEGECEVSLRIG